MKGSHGQHLLTFLLQTRVNRLTSYENIHRFHPTLFPSPHCPHCPELTDSVAHRLLECPKRLNLAASIRLSLAHKLAKGSNHPWSCVPPPDAPSLKALLHAFWPSRITMQTAQQPAKNPLNETETYDKDDGLLIRHHDEALHGTVDVQFFKDRNPITKAEIEAKKFPDFPNAKATHFERISQIHVIPHSPDPRNPKPHLILSIRAFTALWHKYSTRHGSTQQAADLFYRDLTTLLTQEKEGTLRGNSTIHQQKAKTSWSTPAPFLEILVKTFNLEYERYCSPLNFCPLFTHGSTIGSHPTEDSSGTKVNSRWGFAHDAKLQDWTTHFGYANPEWNEDDIIDCINKAEEAAASSPLLPVRNIAILPYNSKTEAYLKAHSPHHRVLIVLSPNTFAFTPYQVIEGTRSDFGASAYNNSVALVSWENNLAPPPADEDLALLGKWLADNLHAPNKQGSDDRPQWSHHMEAAVAGYLAPDTAPMPPIHPRWHDLAAQLTPTNDYRTLLHTAAGAIPKVIKDIFTASHANPAKCAAELSRLSLHNIKLFQAAWQQSHNVTPHVVFRKDASTPEFIHGDFESAEGEDPDPECNPPPDAPKPLPAPPLRATIAPRPPTKTTRHTSSKFTRPESLSLVTTPAHKYAPAQSRTQKALINTLTRALEFDEPLVRARLSPQLSTQCPHCNTLPAVRTFSNHVGVSVPSCAQCRTEFETKITYGKFSLYSPHCSQCGSHEHRNGRARHHTGPDAALKGWRRKGGGLLCQVCTKDLRAYRKVNLPPTNFHVATCKRIVRSTKCLICHDGAPTQANTRRGLFLHHSVCGRHLGHAPSAHTLTIARVWQYLNTTFPPMHQNTHNVTTITNWVNHHIAHTTPLTTTLLASLAVISQDHHAHTFTLAQPPPPPP